MYMRYGLGQKPDNRQFLKTHPDAQTEAKKEDESGETRTYGNPTLLSKQEYCRQ